MPPSVNILFKPLVRTYRKGFHRPVRTIVQKAEGVKGASKVRLIILNSTQSSVFWSRALIKNARTDSQVGHVEHPSPLMQHLPDPQNKTKTQCPTALKMRRTRQTIIKRRLVASMYTHIYNDPSSSLDSGANRTGAATLISCQTSNGYTLCLYCRSPRWFSW